MIQPIYINKPLRAIVNLDVQIDMPVRAVEVLLCFTFVCVLSFGVRNIFYMKIAINCALNLISTFLLDVCTTLSSLFCFMSGFNCILICWIFSSHL